ncbi:MAG: hypothetical protein WBP93_10810 [Pyrinomonadaceae bacterium]
MSATKDDADLILRLYEIRREEEMRRARNWFMTEFNPESAPDIFNVMMGEHSADFRMVLSYWDMVATFVNYGLIDEQLFNDINTEHVGVYAKVQPFVEEIRATAGVPPYLYCKNLEPLVLRLPDAKERIEAMRRYMKRRVEAGKQSEPPAVAGG